MAIRQLRMAGALAGALILATISPLPAAADSSTCTESGVVAIAQAPLAADRVLTRGLTRPRIADTLQHCRYGFYRDGSEATFRAGEPFLGAILWFSDYMESDIARADAVNDIEITGDRVYLARVQVDGSLGPSVEQPLSRTPYMQERSPLFGIIVYQQRYFIGHLDPGDYLSTWISTYPGAPDETATVLLHIVAGP
jgi:hypothetical protein